jgi:putative transposase
MYRLCKLAGVLLPKKKRKIRVRRLSVDRKITAPNKLSQFDIKYGFIHGENRFFFVCAFIDVFDRDIRGYHIGNRCTAEDILRTLKLALIDAGIGPENQLVLRSDNGPQMSSRKFEKELLALPADHEFIPIRTPNKNAYIESFFSLLEINLMAADYFYDLSEAFKRVVEYVNFYMEERIHGKLKMPPAQFRREWENKLHANYAVSA